MTRARAAIPVLLLLAAISAGACREEGEIKIASLEFDGVKSVNKGALANALQTKKGSRFFWGRKRFFDRRAFDADLKRIQAFYRDRGFPDARVTVDTKLNETQDEIAITVHVTEGEPIRIATVDFEGFDVLPERDLRRLRRQLQLEPGQPLDRQLAATERERALNALRNNGYPYAEVQLSNEPAGERLERVIFRATPGILAHFGPVEVNGQASVGDYVIERQLSFKPGDIFSQDKMRESQRKLYRMELFQFVNVESVADRGTDAPGGARACHRRGGKTSQADLRVRLRE